MERVFGADSVPICLRRASAAYEKIASPTVSIANVSVGADCRAD